MTDYLTDGLAIAAIVGASGAVLLAVIEWFELKTAKSQIEDERRKIDHLGKLVEQLGRVIEGLEKRSKIGSESLKVQQEALAIQKEQAEWAQKGLFARLATQYNRWREQRKERGNTRGGCW